MDILDEETMLELISGERLPEDSLEVHFCMGYNEGVYGILLKDVILEGEKLDDASPSELWNHIIGYAIGQAYASDNNRKDPTTLQ